ncbi:hypothetical protein CK203_018465 [Vitis vinifera]|uniref:Uncharacterized protein n=1 Tax=Vitis vinifera TaxID=29760 RepID=A0A438J698_VITVI|nr:hypothetical protein CK203_018465 [Vitis vinifera]
MSLLVIQRKVCARLEKIQIDFLWGVGALKKKPHLANWSAICADMRQGGLGNERKIKFWKDLWYEDQALKDAFPNLFKLVVNKDQWVCDAWEEEGEVGSWNPLFSRHFNDWEMEEVEGLL